jgi:hypothetical protein
MSACTPAQTVYDICESLPNTGGDPRTEAMVGAAFLVLAVMMRLAVKYR